MRKKVLTAISAALLMVTAMAFAQPGPGGPNQPGPMPGPGPDGGLIEFLGLDGGQIEAWTAFHDAFRATVEPLQQSMQDLHAQLREALDSETPDATLVGQLLLDIEAIRDEMLAAREALDQNLQSILTADQLIRFEAFRAAQAHMRRGQGGGPGGGLGQGGGNKGPGNGNGPGNGSCK